MAQQPPTATAPPPPLLPGLFGNVRFDAIAGFLVFLIAMPLCLAISRASGFPPIAGIWTAVIGGLVTTFLSDAQLTIKGPAAGLIVIVAGAVSELGRQFGADLPEADRAFLGYKLALGIGVTAGIVQILFGLIKAGRLADFFPLTPVHGMLASIGIIILAKQMYEVIGVAAPKAPPGGEPPGPLELLWDFPGKIREINPKIAVIGLVGLAILFALQAVKKEWVRKVPAQLVALVVAIGLGVAFDLEHENSYLFRAHYFNGDVADGEYTVGPKFLVTIPDVLSHPADAFAYPDFRGVATGTGLKYLLLFTLIGSLESVLSAKAIELLDPWKRKTNFDRDLIAVGLANALAASVGGLPMISEIVRSSANITNGARTKMSNAFHGLFLLAFVLLLPGLIHSIPLAVLGAMLVFTGYRLASPSSFVRTFRVGTDQFVVFLGTIIVTLATDLLIGIAFGIVLEAGFLLWHFKPLSSDVRVVREGDDRVVLKVRSSAVFWNWISLRSIILREAPTCREMVIDLSKSKIVDHSVMEKLHELQVEFRAAGKTFEIIGMDEHTPMSRHPLAARKQANEVAPDANTLAT